MKSLLKKIFVTVCSMLTISFSMMSAFSDFSHNASSSAKTTISAEKNKKVACAYIGSGNKSKLYTIEDALKVAAADTASNTVFVIPGSVATISEDCTIAEGDSLVLPYEDEKTTEYIYKESFADKDTSSVKSNRVINISIASNITLTNNGTLTIGGQLGAGGGSSGCYNGQTAGKYAQITMCSDSHIISSGTTNVYGYIKRNSKTDTTSNIEIHGTVNAPMVVYDFKGGTYTSNMLKKKILWYSEEGVFPISEYDFPNIQCTAKIFPEATYNGLYDIYASSSHNSGTVSLINKSNGLFRLSSGYLTMTYSPSSWNDSESFTTDDKKQWTTQIQIYGNCTFNSISITLKISLLSYTINSADYYLPLPYKFDIEICKDSVFTTNEKVKVMTGAKMTIDSGATADIKSNLSFYTSYTDQSQNARYPSFSEATIVNNGTLVLNGGSKASNKKEYGGIVQSSVVDATLQLVNSYIEPSVTTKEMNGDSKTDHKETLQGNNSSGKLFTFSVNKTYTSKYNSDGTFYYWE